MRIPNATSWKVHVIEANIDSFDTFMKENNRNHLYITKLQDFWFECEQKQKEIEKMFHEWVNAKKVNLRNEILQIEQNQQTDLVTQFQTMSTGTKLSKKRKFLQIENEKEDSRPNKKRKQNHINACNVNIQSFQDNWNGALENTPANGQFKHSLVFFTHLVLNVYFIASLFHCL